MRSTRLDRTQGAPKAHSRPELTHFSTQGKKAAGARTRRAARPGFEPRGSQSPVHASVWESKHPRAATSQD